MYNNTTTPFILTSGTGDRGPVQVDGQLQQQWGKGVCDYSVGPLSASCYFLYLGLQLVFRRL